MRSRIRPFDDRDAEVVASYNIAAREFYFYYRFEGETTMQRIFPSPEVFLTLADMFRTEGPVNFNTDGNYFVTGPRWWVKRRHLNRPCSLETIAETWHDYLLAPPSP